MARNYTSKVRNKVIQHATEMRTQGLRVNKSRIARECHCTIRAVFNILPAVR